MKQLARFTAILLVIVVAIPLTLVVTGVFSSDEFWSNLVDILKLVGIGVGATAAILLIAKK
jgi:hypothetical protein